MPRLRSLVFVLTLFVAKEAGARPHEHDGLYARFSAGPSLLAVHRATERTGPLGSLAYLGDESSVEETALALELSVGGTPFPHVAIAGTLLVDLVPVPELTLLDGSPVDLAGPLAFVLLGPSVDVYPNRNRGIRVGAGVGVAHLRGTIDDRLFDSFGGTGAGVTFALGYEEWIAEEWSAGLAARATFALLGGRQRARGVEATERDGVRSLSLVATVVLH